MTHTIDLNCDMGESFGNYTLGLDEEVMPYITSANIACGFHAGDPEVMDHTVKLAATHNVGIGAHPGYPDRLGFGRRFMECSADEIRTAVAYQIGALQAFCHSHSVPLRHVKPHGALYLAAVGKEKVARAVAEAIVAVDPKLKYVALAGAKGAMMTRIGQELGLEVVYEAFPDRAYTPDGTLVARREEGAVIHDPKIVAQRALKMAMDREVVAINGSVISLNAQTLCVHGDNPAAVDLVREIRMLLEKNGITVAPVEST